MLNQTETLTTEHSTLSTLKLILNFSKFQFFRGQKVNFWRFQGHSFSVIKGKAAIDEITNFFFVLFCSGKPT